MEFWGKAMLPGVLHLARKFLLVDDCMEKKRLGFPWACIRLDLSRSLRSRI